MIKLIKKEETSKSSFFKSAFTLIELLVVIAIIGILSGLIIVGMNGMTQKATIAKAQVFSNSLRNSLLMNIVDEWKFDSISGTVGSHLTDATNVVDTWGNNNGLTYNGPTLRNGSDCVSGQCLQFDTNDYVNFGSTSNTDLINMDQFTLAFWIKTQGTYVLSRGQSSSTNGSYLIYYNVNGFIFKASSSFESIIGKATGDWQYLTIVYDRNTSVLSAYNNGIRDYLYNSVTLTKYVNNLSLMLGTGDTMYFNGLIDDVRIYNNIISASQIKEQYYAGLNNLLSSRGITKEEYSQRLNSFAIR